MDASEIENGHLEATGGARLFYRWHVPSNDDGVLGCVVVVHGFAEHSGRYLHVLEALTRAGYACLALDVRGHGRSEGRRGFVNRFDEYHRDLDAALAFVREKKVGGPTFLLGHSQGGLIVSSYVLDNPHAADGMILSSPAMGVALQIPVWKEGMARFMSNVWPPLALPSGIGSDQISRDKETIAAYEADPLVFKSATARWYTEFRAIQATMESAGSGIEMPLLLLQAGSDQLVSPEASRAFHDGLASSDKTFELYEACYHELFNEPEREEILATVIAWLRARSD